MFLSNFAYIIKDIYYLYLFWIKYLLINNKLVFNLDLLVFIYRGDAIYKGIKISELNYLRFNRLLKDRVLYREAN